MSHDSQITIKESKRRYWSERISAWKSSGLSQKQFCSDNGLNFSTFKYWHVQLKADLTKEKRSFIKVASRDMNVDMTNHQPRIQIRTHNACINLYSHANDDLIKWVLRSMGVSAC